MSTRDQDDILALLAELQALPSETEWVEFKEAPECQRTVDSSGQQQFLLVNEDFVKIYTLKNQLVSLLGRKMFSSYLPDREHFRQILVCPLKRALSEVDGRPGDGYHAPWIGTTRSA